MSAIDDAARALVEAAAAGNRLVAWEAASRVIAHLANPATPAPPDRVRTLVWSGGAKYRWFDIAELIAATAAARPDATPGIRRLHAQMLLERGFTEEALARLHPLLHSRSLSPYHRGQAFGHVGRIYKDRFVEAVKAGDEAAARAHLMRALDEGYLAGYHEDSSRVWLGVNAMALLARPEAAAVKEDATDIARRIAREVREQALRQTSNEDRLYAEATIAETFLATGECEAALEHVKTYLAKPVANVFALNNFRRQLAEVWRLDQRPFPCPELLAYVSAAVLEKEGGLVQPSATQLARVQGMDYQAVFGSDRFDSFENYRRGLERCACIARVGRTAEIGVGTAFVVPGRLLSDKLDGAFVLVTNAHVISETDAERSAGAVHPLEAVVTFAALDGVDPTTEFRIARVISSSPRQELDFAVVELAAPVVPKAPYPIAPVLPVASSRVAVRIIGHPSGRGLSLSSNVLLDHQAPKLHYSTATEGGSSGSPVFSHDWKLMGLHHAGGDAVPQLNGKPGTYAANEGI